MKMNNNQQAIYEIIARAIERPSVTALVVLKRVAGTGKTQIHVTLYSYYCLRMNKNQDNNELQKFIVYIASLGMATLPLSTRLIVYSFFVIHLDITLESELGAYFKQACLLKYIQRVA